MTTFKDADGKEWTITVTFSEIKRVRKLIHIDLLDHDQLKLVTQDLVLIADVIYAIVQPQADHVEVSDLQFGELLGHCFEGASRALMESLADFFHRVGHTTMATLIETTMNARTKAERRLTKALDPTELSQAVEAVIARTETNLKQELADLIRGTKSSGSPASPASPTSAP